MDQPNRISDGKLVVDPSEDHVSKYFTYRSNDMTEEREEEPSEELVVDPENKSSEELEKKAEKDPKVEQSDKFVEEPSEEAGVTQIKESSECHSLANQAGGEAEQTMDSPIEVSTSVSHCHCDTCEADSQSMPVGNNSNERKRSLDAIAGLVSSQGDQMHKRYKHEESPKPQSEFGCGIVDLFGETEQQKSTGSSGKRRRSRWEQQPEGGGEIGEDDQTIKRRKLRWAIDDSQLNMLGPLKLPDFSKEYVMASDLDSEYLKLKAKLLEINSKLKRSELHEERSPSPEPVFNNLGIRLNTREVRLGNKLVQEGQHIISMLIKKNPTFEPPPVYKPLKLFKKIYIPVKEYPGYNFIGLIIGPRGNTQQKMEKETGAKILLRGKGSSTTAKKYDTEDLHVYIEAENQTSLDAAVTMVEKLLIPIDERMNCHKRAQLQELAKLNGTFKDENTCNDACPENHSTFGSGSNIHQTDACSLTISSPHSKTLHYSRFGSGSTPNRRTKPNKESSDANLYVGYLPQVVDDYRLAKLFSPFGKLKEVKVIKDRSTGISKGYGFIKFENPCDAAVAVEHLNGYKVDGKILAVRVAGHPQVAGSSLLSHLPVYLGPAAWSGPPGSLLPEPQASFPRCEDAEFSSSSIQAGQDLLPTSEVFFGCTPPPILSGLNSSGSLPTFYSSLNQIKFSYGDQDSPLVPIFSHIF